MKKLTIILMIMLLILPINVMASQSTSDEVSLSNCVDGNSARFMLRLTEIKVKFLGIEAAENIIDEKTNEVNDSFVKDYVCDALKSAKKIKIEYEPNIEREDKYGRIQAWVYIDGVLLQEDLVKQGYAKVVYINDDYLHAKELKSALSYAKEKKLGIWKNEEEKVEPKKEEEKEERSKNFFEIIIDFIVGLFDGLIKLIDDIISNIL
ncbi:MAG: thermonuclease family protein [Bacilli bacterium]|nr:thermonuclease family protein [Bacilli bacterium]